MSASTAKLPKQEWSPELAELAQAFRAVFASVRRLRGRDTHLCGTAISHAQYELLIELHERGELSVGELASAAQLTPASVTQMLEHLSDSGLVERARSEADRRVVVTRLTARGHREIEAKRVEKQAIWERALGDVDAAELRAATGVLTRLVAIFDEA